MNHSPESRFEQLYLAHYGMVLQLCLGFFEGNAAQAKDLAQEVFIRVWNNLLEAYSLRKGKSITHDGSASESLGQEKNYLRLRLRIHGFFTYLTLGAYTLGFLLLLPECSTHVSFFWMSALVASYFVPGIILTLSIRKNVQKELRELKAVVALGNDLAG